MKNRNPLITILLLSLSVCASCGGQSQAPETSVNSSGNKNPLVTITMEDGKQIFIELYPDIAPNTVNSFISLINKKFYDGVIFHRVIPGFMIQGGDPEGTGQGGPGYMLFGEFSNNGFKNDLKHKRGVLSMARRGNPYDPQSAYNTAGSQFFIMVEDSPFLDGKYAAFGKVVQGLETAHAIVATPTDSNDRPRDPQVIRQITVETFGADYEPPEKLPDFP